MSSKLKQARMAEVCRIANMSDKALMTRVNKTRKVKKLESFIEVRAGCHRLGMQELTAAGKLDIAAAAQSRYAQDFQLVYLLIPAGHRAVHNHGLVTLGR